jgi:hypothetical protein
MGWPLKPIAKIESRYTWAALVAKGLPNPKTRFFQKGVATYDMPNGAQRAFSNLARELPGAAIYMGCGRWFVFTALLRMLDPARADTAWRDLPKEEGLDRNHSDRALPDDPTIPPRYEKDC